MTDKYGVVEYKNGNGVTNAFSVVEMALWPKDLASFMDKTEGWYRNQVIESLKFATFAVTLRQTTSEARHRAQEYARFMSMQHQAMAIAKEAIQLSTL